MEFAVMNAEQISGGMKLVFSVESKSGVSIKYIAVDADNDEVIMPEQARYILKNDIIELNDPYDGFYFFAEVIEQ